MSESLDPIALRAQFPSLNLKLEGHPAIFFDNPGGTQVPESVVQAVSHYYLNDNANAGGSFLTSHRTDSTISSARGAMGDLLNARGHIVFGANMTSLTFNLARSIGDTIRPGDEIVITDLEHDGNVSPWTDLQANGAVIKYVPFRKDDCTLDMTAMQEALTERTRLVAVTHASNAVGTVPDVATVTRMAHAVGAIVFVDAVQYAPHGPIDVQALDCDFLVCSAYKFFGPHVGVLFGKSAHLDSLKPHKVRPALDRSHHRWETGTLNHEGLAGVAACVGYLADLGMKYGTAFEADYSACGFHSRRFALKTAMHAIREYEQTLSRHLLDGLQSLGDVTIYGITDPDRMDERVPTFAFTWPRLSPRATASHLAQHGICCWDGNYYALRLMERLGLEEDGGAIRIGLAHYNTHAEIDKLLEVLSEIPRR